MMKKIIYIIICFSVHFAMSQDCEWITERDVINGYRADFPKEPTALVQEVATELGTLDMHMKMLDNSLTKDANNLIYMSAFVAYPNDSDYTDEALQNSMLNGSINGAANNVKGRIISNDTMRFNGYNGREAKIAIQNDAYVIHLRNVLVNNKLYFLQTISEKGKEGNAEELRFFNSFDLIKIKE